MKKVIIVPDSFKGTLSSKEVCSIISCRLKSRLKDLSVTEIPVADGGEGTAEVFFDAFGGRKEVCSVKSPLGRDIEAYVVFTDGETAVVESALASGISIEKENNALLASSYGTGQLIKTALDAGAKKIFVGIGGSATTDGGSGFLAALGARFYGEKEEELLPCGKVLTDIRRIDLSNFDKRLNEVSVTVLCDVKNPLYGENGAAYIYAPQKGANEKETELLDRGLRNFAKVSAENLGKDFSCYEGAGAAGGMGFAFKAFLDAEIKSGIDCVLDLCEFEEKAKEADLIITGEGKMDSQSLMGKVPFGVALRCKGKRLIAVTGVNEADKGELERLGFSEVIETNPGHLPFENIKYCAKDMLCAAVEKIKL